MITVITFIFSSWALSPRLRPSGWVSHMNLVYSLQCKCPFLGTLCDAHCHQGKKKFKFPGLTQSLACMSGLSQKVSTGNISPPRQRKQEGIASFNKVQGKNLGNGLWVQRSFPQRPAKEPSWPKSVTMWGVVETGRSLGKLPRPYVSWEWEVPRSCCCWHGAGEKA